MRREYNLLRQGGSSNEKSIRDMGAGQLIAIMDVDVKTVREQQLWLDAKGPTMGSIPLSTDNPPFVEGLKFDDGKLPLDLWSPEALEATAEVLGFGAEKYGAYNWAKGLHYRRVFAALLRHLWAWWKGEKLDKETNLHHLAHAMCCLMFLLHYEMNRRKYHSFDDRPK